jgi:hypothetical protein
LKAMQTRLLNALAAIRKTATPNQNQMLDFLLNQANSQATSFLNGESSSSPVHNILANVKSLLANAKLLPTPSGGLVASSMSDEGDLVGPSKYESLDFGWTESAACWLEHIPPGNKAVFPTNPPATIPIEDSVSIAIAGDWGTGFDYRTDKQPAPAQKVAEQIKNIGPTYSVHLGDVYYAGTASEENEKFISLWPEGSKASFTLNSNHEMYSGALGYFNNVLEDPKFAAQKNSSYLAMQNDNWLVIALDTAYHADEIHLYQQGNLDTDQCDFLDGLLNNDTKNRRTILLTHHNGLSVDGVTLTALWGQIAPRFANRELWWYWGHMHAGVVYSDRGNVHPRCCGHGAIPAGAPDSLASNPSAIWYESQQATDLLYSGRVRNGFVLLNLEDRALTETFINEDGVKVFTQTFKGE